MNFVEFAVFENHLTHGQMDPQTDGPTAGPTDEPTDGQTKYLLELATKMIGLNVKLFPEQCFRILILPKKYGLEFG